MTTFLPLDLHAHIHPHIAASALNELDAVVFAVTRSLEEAELALKRTDETTIWGVGCHPGLAKVQNAFDTAQFQMLVERTPYAGELGLDGASRVPLDIQRRTLESALRVLQKSPRITSLHSYKATNDILSLVENYPQPGLILHWWLGSEATTAKAIELGCYFSINRSSARRKDLLAQIPLNRVLPETDHPFGDKGRKPRRPGEVSMVEGALADIHGLSREQIRVRTWRTLATIVSETRTIRLFPDTVSRGLAIVNAN